MRKYSNELKVGIMVIVFALAGFFVLYFMGVTKKEEGISYVIQFNQVGGISKGDAVRYAGVNIGKVKSVEIRRAPIWDWDDTQKTFVPRIGKDGRQIEGDVAFVTILITDLGVFKSRGMVFTDKTEVTVATSIMNERWIEIRPRPGRPLGRKDVILGKSPVTLEDLIAKGEEAITKLMETTDAVNDIIGDPSTRENIKLSLKNFRKLTEELKEVSVLTKRKIDAIATKVERLTDNANLAVVNVNRQITLAGGDLRRFTNTLNRIASNNEGDIRQIVKELKRTSISLHRTIKTVESLVTRKEFSEDILTTLHNIKNASEEVEGIASDIRAITSDGQIREDLKVAIHEARMAATGANRLIQGVNNTLGIDGKNKKGKKGSRINMRRFVELNAEAEYDNKKDETVPNVNVTLLPEGKSSVKVGVDSLGYDNLFNLQYRYNLGVFRPRIGVIRSKLGGGTDLHMGKSADVFVDAYNPRDWQVDLTGRFNVSRSFYIHGGVRDVFDTKRAVFGVGTRF